MLESLTAVDHVSLPPEGGGTVRAFSRIGYDLPEALADLIDNSIDANASRVEITIFRDDSEITAITIADDGRGMNRDQLLRGMQFAGKTKHLTSELGTYGMGLKSASFSQCSRLTVVTRQGNETIASRWAAETIDRDWRCELLDPKGATSIFDEYCMKGRRPACGTLVVWEQLDRLGVGADIDALEEFFATSLPRLTAHLGLVFHRFLQHDTLAITVAVKHLSRTLSVPRPVRPQDPFGYPNSGAEGWPKTLTAAVPEVGVLELQAHIWPDGITNDSYLLGGRKGAELQGFYFYRNNRLIQAGGWNGVLKNEHDPELSLARVAIELPPGGLDVNVQKSALQVTAAQTQLLVKAAAGDITLHTYLEAARATYKAARRPEVSNTPKMVPGPGFAMGVRRSAQKRLAKDENYQEIGFVWDELREDQLFELAPSETKIILNRDLRRAILGDAPASAADAPIVKMLLFLLLKDEFFRSRISRKQIEKLGTYNALLLDVLKHK